MGAMTRLYEERNLGIVDEDTFDLEKEYEIYCNESKFMDKVWWTKEKVLNNIKHSGDKKLISTANRASAAKIGTARAASKMDGTVMATYKKPGRKELVDSYDNYKKKRYIEYKYDRKLKNAEKDRAANKPADSKAPAPTLRPAYA